LAWRPYITRRIPILILAVTLIITMANYFFGNLPYIQLPRPGIAGYLTNWANITLTFALALGIVQLTMLRGRWLMNPKETPRRRGLSALFLAEMWIITIVGITLTTRSAIFSWISTQIYATITSATNGLIGVYITLACYRTLKVLRRWDVALFSGIVFMDVVANTPLVSYVIGYGWFSVSQWFYFWPADAGGKALAIIAAVGMISVGIRGMLGMERGILGGGAAGK
jgi:hypothetical protein